MGLIELPLFPLGTVLFPGFGQGMHVFEERYRSLIADCLAGSQRFGVVAIARGIEVGGEAEAYRVGTLVQITELTRLPDGRYTLVAEGLERLRIHEIVTEGTPYLRGRVELWPDENTPAATGTAQSQVSSMFSTYLERLLAAAGQDFPVPLTLPRDARRLSLLIATLIQAPLPDRQRLLEAPSPGARIAAEIHLLERESALMKTTRAAPAPNAVGLRGSFSNN